MDRDLFLHCLLIALLSIAASTRGAEFWVASDGADSNPGTVSKPFASLEHARDAVRRAKQAGQGAGAMTVWLKSGDYFRTNCLTLTAEDSGSSQAPVYWRAYKNQPVRLLGGVRLGGFAAVSDPKILERLDPRARSHVIEVHLKDLGPQDLGGLASRGFGRPIVPAHAELFFDHKPMTLARWPNQGDFTRIAGYPASSDRKDEHGGNLGELSAGFLYSGDRPSRWRADQDIWVHGYWAYDWANSYEKVQAIDPLKHLVKTAPPYGIYGFRQGQRFYFLNILEELDEPGEWYLDRATQVLYFWPPSKLDKAGEASHELLLSTLSRPLVVLQDASFVTLQGIAFEATRSSALEIHGGQSNHVAGCLIRNVGNIGVTIEGGTGNGVSSCDIFDTGDGGVSLSGGDRQTLSPGGHFVENCHFQRQGRWSKCYVPAVSLTGVGLRASHNLIQDHPHCAILFWGNDHLIEFNEIHHIALETGDVGAIYTGRDYTFRGNRIRYNYIHHTGGVGMGSMGVYMDDCVSGTEVFGNLFYKVHWAMFIGGGRDHRVENNLFVDCDPAVRIDGRGLDKAPVWHGMVDDTMRKRLAEVPLALYRERYPDMKSLDRYYGAPDGLPITGEAFRGVPPENNLIARNVCVGKWLEAGWHAEMEMLRVENNLTNATASLLREPNANAAAKDFELTKESPAWALGFQALPFSQMGIQKNVLRAGLQNLEQPAVK